MPRNPADYRSTVVTVAGAVLDVAGAGRTLPDGTVALHDVALRVHDGEFVGLVGPSGCGRSTLLRLAAGPEVPSSGSVQVTSSRIGDVVQDPTLLPWRSARRNVELLAGLERVPRRERGRRATDALRLAGLVGPACSSRTPSARPCSCPPAWSSWRPDRGAVPFPCPRTPALRFAPEFGRLAGEVSHTLRDESRPAVA